jgi:hypothetical protein
LKFFLISLTDDFISLFTRFLLYCELKSTGAD